MKPVAAGLMRERVTIQSATSVRDAYGSETLTWVDVTTVWARVTDRVLREPVMLDDRPVAITAYEVVIRAGVEITHKSRLIWRTKTLYIDQIAPQPDIGMIVLRCMEAEA